MSCNERGSSFRSELFTHTCLPLDVDRFSTLLWRHNISRYHTHPILNSHTKLLTTSVGVQEESHKESWKKKQSKQEIIIISTKILFNFFFFAILTLYITTDRVPCSPWRYSRRWQRHEGNPRPPVQIACTDEEMPCECSRSMLSRR